MGCDAQTVDLVIRVQKFQSTHPSWGATLYNAEIDDNKKISIHAPIVGCDRSLKGT